MRRRRTVGMEVDANGSVLFAVPADADPAAVAEAVRSRLPRLAVEVQRRQGELDAPLKVLVSGTALSYLGRRYRLRVIDERRDGVRLRHGWLELPRPDDAAEGSRRIAGWFTARGSRWLAARAAPLAVRLGVTPSSVTAADLGGRWGACSPDHRITVHWAVLQLPPELVDFVLVHELVHLRVPGHGAEFRRRLRLAIPDVDDRAQWFAAEEPRLWRGAVR